jgi:hypothetical protein
VVLETLCSKDDKAVTFVVGPRCSRERPDSRASSKEVAVKGRSIALLLGVVATVGAVAVTTAAAHTSTPSSSTSRTVALGVTITPALAFKPGDTVWTTTAAVPPPAKPDANGCVRVPSSGYIGHLVYASSSAEYATYWQWSSGSSSEPFYWYIKHTDGSNQSYGYSSGGGSQNVPGNVYYWEVQNQGSDPQAWEVCFNG